MRVLSGRSGPGIMPSKTVMPALFSQVLPARLSIMTSVCPSSKDSLEQEEPEEPEEEEQEKLRDEEEEEEQEEQAGGGAGRRRSCVTKRRRSRRSRQEVNLKCSYHNKINISQQKKKVLHTWRLSQP